MTSFWKTRDTMSTSNTKDRLLASVTLSLVGLTSLEDGANCENKTWNPCDLHFGPTVRGEEEKSKDSS